MAGQTIVKATHISELRQAVDAVRKVASLAPGAYTDGPLTGVPIKAVHVSELRMQLNAALTALGIPLPTYTDAGLSGIAIKRAHLQELRDVMK